MLPFKQKDHSADHSSSNEHKPQLAMLISAGKIKCAIYELQQQEIHILGVGEKTFSSEGKEEQFEYKVFESAAADAIDSAVQVAEVDIKECIFGVPQSWLFEQNLKDEYNSYIEKLSRALDIEGVAFVSVPHAIAYFLQYEHKVQPTTFLVGCTREGATLSYVQKGKVVENHKIAWQTAKLGNQIANGLSLFKLEGEKPSSMYLYGVGDLSSARAELQQHDWQQDQASPSFVARPEITVLPNMIDVHALALVGAKDFAKQNGITGRLTLIAPQLTILPEVYTEKAGHHAITQATIPRTDPSPEVAETDESAKIEQALAELAGSVETSTSIATPVSAAPLGFVRNADIRTVDPHTLRHQAAMQEEVDKHVDALDEIEGEEQMITEANSDNDPEVESEEKDTYHAAPAHRPLFSRKRVISSLVILVTILLLGGGGLVLAYYQYPTAEVIVYVQPKNIDKTIEITAQPDASISTTNNTLPLQKIESELVATASLPATGTKTIGESAKGTMIMYNKTTNEQQIKKGTTLKVNSLEFTTDADITIASASASIQGQTNGKSEVAATAKAIGPAGNLKKGQTLAVGSLARTEVEAEVKDDFTGGTEETVKVVSAKDLTALTTALRDKAKAQETEIISGQSSTNAGEIRFAEAISKGKETISLDKKANDEANEVKGELRYTISTFAVLETDVETLLKQVVDQSIPSGFEKLTENTQKVGTTFVAYKDNTLTFRASPSAQIIPIIDTKALIPEIVGKKEADARTILKKHDTIYDAAFNYNVTLPEMLKGLPQKADNISIKREVRQTNI